MTTSPKLVSRAAAAALLLACASPWGCGDDDSACPAPAGTAALFDPTLAQRGSEPSTWLAFPYPSDHRRRADGHPRLDDFPNPDDVGLIEEYAGYAEETLDGFGLNSPVYVAFDGPLALASLPAAPEAFLVKAAAIQLVDVTPTSEEYGARRPLIWEYWGEPGKYVAGHSLAVAPAWGFPLRERTTYALILTTGVRDAAGHPLSQPPLLGHLLGTGVPASCLSAIEPALLASLQQQYAPLATWLARDGIAAKSVVAATLFTTQDFSSELAAIRRHVATALDAPAHQEAGWQELDGAGVYHVTRTFRWNSSDTVTYHVMEGRFTSPNFQHGRIPYAAAADGGAFLFVDGEPQPHHFEELRFVLTIPDAPPPDGGDCYPIVEYAHGTGGNAYGFSSSTAGRLAARGVAGIGIDQPLHGLRKDGRGFDESMMSFNFLNPASARANFRQSAADTFSLTRFVRESLLVPAAKSFTNESICFDPERVGFFGHSHGGLTGSLAAAYETDVDPWVLSGAGGGLSITVLERNDVVDVAGLMALFLLLEEGDEPLSELHPAVGLLQTLVEVTDPINYAPYWVDRPGLGAPQSVLATSGIHDEATPYRTATALAVSGRIPLVEPVAVPIPDYEWAGVPHAEAPVGAGSNGATTGFIQWTDDIDLPDYDSHFVIFYRPEAIHASMRFFESAAYEAGPVIERDADADVR